MRYMLMVYVDENAMTDSERQQCYVDSAALTRDLDAKGQYVAAAPLHSVNKATSVRIRNGKSTVTDGPFAETREQLGGFYIIEAKNLDEAIAVADSNPAGDEGNDRDRPVMEIPGLTVVADYRSRNQYTTDAT